MKHGELHQMSPPPTLTPPQDPSGFNDEEQEDKPPLIQPIGRSLPDEDKTYIYQILYPHSQTSESSYARPVTPLQISPPEGNATSPTVPVSCGQAHGKMHLHMFLCPGIHQPCIEIGNELLSPKQFTIRGDKERQKDWKASIRIGRSSLRTHMEASTIDFFDHENRCSGKCQSRNYVNAPTEREEVAQSRKAKRNADVSFLKNEIECEITGKELEEKKNGKKTRGRPRGSVNKPRPPNKEQQDETFFEEFFTDEPLVDAQLPSQEFHPAVVAPPDRFQNGCSSSADIVNCLQNDPVNFWSQMQHAGVISHFCDDIIVSAINLKQSAIENQLTPTVANTLTRAVFALGVQNVVVHRVQSIERSVHQQRKHEEMFVEIHSKVQEEQRQKHPEDLTTTGGSIESVHTALEIQDSDELIDVVKYEDFPPEMSSMSYHQPGPSNGL
ncbi:unnamed protein product [Caenorhabditis sp. 36 PRJEB53466]|nr:unnamed protein product [Caenorhabditis sp. 36 PRJEB53466]